MSKSKSKKSTLNLVLDVAVILLCVVLICTLAMTAFSTTIKVYIGTNTTLIPMTEFLGSVFNGDYTSAWAIIAVITYFISLLIALCLLVVAVLDVFGIHFKKLPKYALPVLLCIFVGLTLLVSIIFANVQTNTDAYKILGAVMSISWATVVAMLCSAGTIVAKVFEK